MPKKYTAEVSDSLTNIASGMGTEKSKKNSVDVVSTPVKISDDKLTLLYKDDWLIGKIVDVISDDATRNWLRFTDGLDVEQTKKVLKLLKKLKAKTKVNYAMKMGRLYGDSILIQVDKKGKDLETPMQKVDKKNPLVALHVIEKDRLYIPNPTDTIDDPLDPNYGQPKIYELREHTNTTNSKNRRVHSSRVLRFPGLVLPFKYRTTVNQGWNGSVVDRVFDALADFTSVKNGFSQLIDELNVDTISIENLSSITNDDTQFQLLLKRFKAFSDLKSVYRVAIKDKDEEYERNELKLAGAKDLIEAFEQIVAGASETPLTKVFGTSAKGMNATGKGDADDYDETIQNKQEFVLRPNLEVLFSNVVRSVLPDEVEFEFEFNPLGNPSEKEKAETHKIQAETDEIHIRNNTRSEKEVRDEIIKTGRYDIKGDLKEKPTEPKPSDTE